MSKENKKKCSDETGVDFSQTVASTLRRLINNSAPDYSFDKTVNQYEKVLIGLSGGTDSTALTMALSKNADEFGFKPIACHVNHHIRGVDADDDQQFCEKLCRDLNVPLDIRHVGVKSDSLVFADPWIKRLNKSMDPSEALLRRVRYDLLLEAAKAEQIKFIVVAHTLEDQTETLLFRLFRGTSLAGITGMQPMRDLSKDCVLLRPMLTLSRAECIRSLNSEGITARQDISNQDSKYTRNYLRHIVIPSIEQRFPGFASRVENFRTVSESEEEYLREIAQEKLRDLEDDNDDCHLPLLKFRALSIAIKRRIIALALQKRGIEVSFERVEKILALTEKREKVLDAPRCEKDRLALSLNERWDVRVERNEIIWLDKTPLPTNELTSYRLRMPGITAIPLLDKAIRIDLWDKSEPVPTVFPASNSLEAIVDLADIKPPLILRERYAEDVIQPFGMQQRIKLKKYLHTHKFSANLVGKKHKDVYDFLQIRKKPIVIVDQNEVIWVPGIGLSEKIRVKNMPTHSMQWIQLQSDKQLLT